MKPEEMIISFALGYAAGNFLIFLWSLYQDYKWKKQLEENYRIHRILAKQMEDMIEYPEKGDRK